MARRPYGGACAWMLGLDMRHPRNTKAGIGAKVRGWSKAPGQGERGDRLGFLARWGVHRTPRRDKLIGHGSYLAAQVKGTTGEGLTGKKAQRKWQFGRVYSSGCGDGIPPAGRGGFHPERGATPVSNGRGFAFRERCDVLSQNGSHRAGTEPSKIRLSAYSESAATRHKGAFCLVCYRGNCGSGYTIKTSENQQQTTINLDF